MFVKDYESALCFVARGALRQRKLTRTLCDFTHAVTQNRQYISWTIVAVVYPCVFYHESGNVGEREASHSEHAHLNSGSRGIALWPQLSHWNQPSARSAIVRNSFPIRQYGQRIIGTV